MLQAEATGDRAALGWAKREGLSTLESCFKKTSRQGIGFGRMNHEKICKLPAACFGKSFRELG
jgi:hypothetical protein